MLRFLHCADLHLDRSFEGLHTISKRVKKMPAINEQMLENIVFIAIDKKVDINNSDKVHLLYDKYSWQSVKEDWLKLYS